MPYFDALQRAEQPILPGYWHEFLAHPAKCVVNDATAPLFENPPDPDLHALE